MSDSWQCGISVLPELIERFSELVGGHDENPLSDALPWCRISFAEAGYINFDVSTPGSTISRRHEEAYLNLRDSARIHIAFNGTPALLEIIEPL
ncbi:hypothetical protein K3495_g9406 [Podosphaera aphanis]|nr:hypothetical protein K3495_g9406 [Podosphaera aphanis]